MSREAAHVSPFGAFRAAKHQGKVQGRQRVCAPPYLLLRPTTGAVSRNPALVTVPLHHFPITIIIAYLYTTLSASILIASRNESIT